MSLFPNYIYFNIFNCILSYINHSLSVNNSSSLQFCINNNEIISYSLISKSIFKIISNILNQKLNFKNYKYFKYFLNNSNESYKLINNKDSVLVFENLDEFNIKKLVNSRLTDKCKQVLFKGRVFEMMSTYYSSNFQFNITASEFEIEILDKIFKSINNSNKKSTKQLFNQIKVIIYENMEEKVNVIKRAIKLEPKKLIFIDQEFHDLEDMPNILESSKLKKLKFTLLPKYLSKLSNETTALEKLVLYVDYHDIILYLNDKMDRGEGNSNEDGYLFSNDIKSFTSDWSILVEKLSSNKTIKHLRLIYRCSFCDSSNLCISGIDTCSNSFSKGLKSILSNSTSIETLQLNDDVIFDSNLIHGIIQSKSLTTLITTQVSLEFIVKNILIYNKSIRNLVLYFTNPNEDFEALQVLLKQEPYSTQVNLYSLSFSIDDIPLTNKYFEILSSFNQMNNIQIKEFNLNLCQDYFIKRFPQKNYYSENMSPIKYQYLINNTIINITKDKNINYNTFN